MARTARTFSRSGYSHVIIKGIGGMILFERSEDYRFFLAKMKAYSEETEVKICAYCLMDNHVHMLVYDPELNLPLFFKKLCVSYSQYYNRRYERNGHVFQDRYKSFEIDDNSYLLSAFRYILNNPVKAGICGASEYRWSSYREYCLGYGITDVNHMKWLLGEETNLDSFLQIEEECEEMEFDAEKHDDAWASAVIKELLDIDSPRKIKQLKTPLKDEALRVLIGNGISKNQLSRLTGMSRGTIRNRLNKN